MNNIDMSRDIEYILGEILIKNKLTISSAESCTGGMVGAKLIGFPGISEVYLEGAITYSNESKINRLGVKEETLLKYGAVSEETAIEMAKGIAKNFNTDIGLSTTGLAGPGGGTDEKPVGLLYVGIYIKGKMIVKKFNFTGSRQNIRVRTTKNLLNELRLELIK